MTVNDITVEINLSILYGVYLGLDSVLLCKRANYENLWANSFNKIFSFNTLERTPIFDVCGAPFLILSTVCTNRKFFSLRDLKAMNGKVLRERFVVDDTNFQTTNSEIDSLTSKKNSILGTLRVLVLTMDFSVGVGMTS